MNRAQLRERWTLFQSKGGKLAGTYWLIRMITRVDIFKLMSTPLIGGIAVTPLQGSHFLQLRSVDELFRCDPVVYADLDAHCGLGVRPFVQRGGRVYALTGESGVLCQLNIDVRAARIATPCSLVFELAEHECFLSFLYTYPDARRKGWARHLIARVTAVLAAEGFEACHCHVQATNVRSLNTFLAAGWRVRGWLAATAAGRYLGTYCRRGLTLTVKLPALR